MKYAILVLYCAVLMLSISRLDKQEDNVESTRQLVNEVSKRSLSNFREGRIDTTSYKDSWGKHIQIFVERFDNFGIVSRVVSAGMDGEYDTYDDIVVISIYVDDRDIAPAPVKINRNSPLAMR